MVDNQPQAKRRRGRPPKQDRTFDDTKQEIIRTGLALFTEFGFHSAGIDPILKKVNVPKGSFYHYFKNKDEFGYEVLAAYGQYFARKLDKHLLQEDVTPLIRLQCFVDDAKMGMEKFEFRRGCLVGNLMQEVPLLSEQFSQQLALILQDWQRRVAQCFRLAQHTGDISNDVDVDYQAKIFWSGWEGAVMQAKLLKSTQPLDDFSHYFLTNLANQ